MNETATALIPGIILAAGLIWMIVQLIQSAASDGESAGPQSYGEGPYVQKNCAAGKNVAVQLKTMTVQLIEVAQQQNWKIDTDKMNEMLKNAESADGMK